MIGIIGTAGRGSDASKMNLGTFQRMCETAKDIIRPINHPVNLISGGAPWADHVAVDLYLTCPLICGLTIEFPCKFEKGAYVSGEIYDGYDIAKVSNHYHDLFTLNTGIDGRAELQKAIEIGAITHFSKGFFDRNCKVAEADILIAFTYGNGAKLKDGGTAHTARCYVRNGGRDLYHCNLYDFTIYHNPEVD